MCLGMIQCVCTVGEWVILSSSTTSVSQTSSLGDEVCHDDQQCRQSSSDVEVNNNTKLLILVINTFLFT